MSTRAEFFQSMYPGLSDGEVIDELIKASIYGFEHGPEVVTISAAEGIHYVPYDAEMQKKLPYYGGAYEACNIPFTDFQIRYQPEQIRIVDGKRILEDTAFLCRKDNDHFLILPSIHVHIVINSLRIAEVPFLPYMDRPADTRAGCKHRCTDAAMEYFKAEVMELCHRENLYQIDLLHGSKNRITEHEYWAQRKGQAKLDKEAAALPAEEQPAKPTKFETDKEKLRQAIRTALSSATSYGEFAAVLLQQGVTVKESRGRLSYLTPDRTKPITARKLGDDFDRAAVLALLEQNAHRAAEQTATVPEYPRNIRERLQGKKAVQTTPEKDGIQRMVDRAAKRAEGKGAGYDRWAAVHNLKQMAATVAAYGQYGYSPEELDAALVSANADLQDSTAKLKALDAAIREKKELQTQVLAYAKTKPARDGLKAQKTEKARSAYRERHESDFIIADAATRYFRAHGVSKLPSHKALQAEIEQLTAEKNAHYNEYREKKARVKELHTVKSNLSQILQGEKDREKKHEHER